MNKQKPISRKSTIFVESPFQLLLAYEILKKDKSNSISIVVRQNKNGVNNSQTRELIKILDLKIHKFVLTNSVISYVFSLIWFFQVCVRSRRVYIGDECSIFFRTVRAIFKSEKFIILDDGVRTLHSKMSKRYVRKSIFSGKADEVINFQEVKRKLANLSSPTNENYSLVVGSWLVEAGICSSHEYIKALEKLITIAKKSNYKIYYVPHRYETVLYLTNFLSENHIEIYRNKLPIELISLELGWQPRAIYSVASTCLFSMGLIYPNIEKWVYEMPANSILKQDKIAAMDAVYEQLKKEESVRFA